MSFIPHYSSTEQCEAPSVPANIDSEKTVSSLIQRARHLQSQAATYQNNIELAQIQLHLNLMQSDTALQYSNNLTDTPTFGQPQTALIKEDIKQDHCVFLPHQLNALKKQIMAYKLLSKDVPLPPHLQQAVLTPLNSSLLQSTLPVSSTITPKIVYSQLKFPPPNYYQRCQHLVSSLQASHQKSPPLISYVNSSLPPPPPKTQCNAYIPPSSLLKDPITPYAHASSLIPSLLPIGIDPQAIISEREKRMLTRMQHRYQQPNINLQDDIHTRALRLRYKQSKLRTDMLAGTINATMLASSTDRFAFRRKKKITLRESRQVEAIEQQQRSKQKESIQAARRNYLNLICHHRSEIVSRKKIMQTKLSKMGFAINHYHLYCEKEYQKKKERIAKERMLALKNDDDEAYVKLLDEAKDTRLKNLLKQTDDFLQSITQLVFEQQNTSAGRNRRIHDQGTAAADFFRISHTTQESVCQPSIMIGGRLKEYQVKGLQWMISLYNNNLNGILADEMGLGKTIQTISLIAYLIEKKRQNGPFLIIVPLSTLTNWTLEFDKWAPSVLKIVYQGPPQIRKELANIVRSGQFQVLLTSFELIIRDTEALGKVDWLYLIMDEGHRIKNANSRLTRTLRQDYHARYRLVLTGTPLQNSLPELWALLNFVLPKIFKSVKTFEEWFNSPFSNQGIQDNVDLNEEEKMLIIKRLHKVLRPFLLRRLKSDVEAELPDKVERAIKCKLSSLQVKIYQQLKNTSVLVHKNNGSNDRSPIAVKGLKNTIMQLRKVCNHPFVFDGVENILNPRGKSNDLLYRCSGKFELLDRMLPKLQQTGHRVLIFFQMTAIMNIMEDYLNWRNYHYLRLDGSTKSDDRSVLLHHFNQPDSPYFIFLLSTRAGGLGLNLQSADTVIIFDSDWNPHQDLQAQDRAHRIGQTKEVRIFRLVTSNSIEERIMARAQYKLDIDGKVIQAGKFDHHSTEEDREALLRTLLEDKITEEVDYDEEASNQQLNDVLKRSDEELAIFKMIDVERGKEKERLIQEDELPNAFDGPENVILNADVEMFDFDRSRKAKMDIKYDDGLTDEQFISAIESGQELPQIGRKRSFEASPKPITRKRNQRMDFKKALEVDTVSRLVRKQLTEIFEACYEAVEESIDDCYRQRCELFMDLVDKVEYPDYYTLIKNPISMNMIKERIHSFYYENILEFKSDFLVMFENARIFNEAGSIVYQDANEMEKLVVQQLEKQCPGGILPKYRKKNTAIDSEYIDDPSYEE